MDAYRRAPGIASRTVADEAVIVRTADGMFFTLNEAGSILWSLADGTRAIDGLAAALADRYGMEAREPEVRAFVEELVAQRLLVACPAQQEPELVPAAPAATGYEPPAIQVQEALEVLAATCGSQWLGYGECQQDGGSCTYLETW